MFKFSISPRTFRMYEGRIEAVNLLSQGLETVIAGAD